MRDRLVHRGPDSFGAYVSRARNRRARLPPPADHRSQRRTPASRWPTRTARVQVVFNGEIYNFKTLREGLRRARPPLPLAERHRGHRPPLRGEGRRLHRRSRRHVRDRDLGRARRRLMLARDRAGKKPLFYYRDDRPAGVRVGDQSVLRAPGHPDRARSRGDARTTSSTATCRRRRPSTAASSSSSPAR